jgi:hypothetical protein
MCFVKLERLKVTHNLNYFVFESEIYIKGNQTIFNKFKILKTKFTQHKLCIIFSIEKNCNFATYFIFLRYK